MNNEGFLLVESMAVLALIAFLTALSFSFMHVFDSLIMRVEIDLLVNTIEAQRAIAVIDGKDSVMTFDMAQNAYIHDSLKHNFTRSVVFAYPQNSYGPPSAPITLIQQPISFAGNTLTCFATGSISSGVIYIGSVKQRIFYALSSSIGQWGVLRLYKYSKNKWCKQID